MATGILTAGGDVGRTQEANDLRRRRMQRRRKLRSVGWAALSISVVLALWELIPVVFAIPAITLPRFSQVVTTLVDSFPSLVPDVLQTVLETLLGFAIALLIGLPLGVAIVFSKLTRDTVYPLLVASQMVPKIAIAPIFLVWFGLGISSKVALAILLSFFAIVINTALGMDSVDRSMVRLMQSMGASRVQTFIKLRLPVAAPNIFVGLRLGMANAVVGAIVGEFIAANKGLGYYILYQNGQLDTVAVYAGVLLIAIVGVILYFLVEVSERFISPLRKRPGGGFGGSGASV